MRKPVGVLGSMAAAALTLTASVGPALAAGHGPQGSHAADRAMSLAWKIVPSPNRPSSANLNQLFGVACPSASACIAVGQHAPQSLAERWNGTTWTIAATPRLAPPAWLQGVSCNSVRACTAVGTQNFGQTLVETWNGATWAVVPSPNVPTKLNALDSVSCVSAQACTAVGAIQPNSPYQRSKTLIESWNGTAWTIVRSPQLPGSFDVLTGVSCVSAQDCTAVGVQGGGDQPLIESWNGTAWKVVPAARIAGEAGGDLAGVVCLSATACTAVGGVYNSTHIKTLVESWNGTAWKIVPSPGKGSVPGLESVSCISVRVCAAVGDFDAIYHGHAVGRTLVESWNGTAWTVVPSPDQGTAATENNLSGVSCASAAFCSAVGDYGSNHRRKTLIELGTPAA